MFWLPPESEVWMSTTPDPHSVDIELIGLRLQKSRLEAGVNKSYEELVKEIPDFTMDTTAARLHIFIEHVKKNLMTEEQDLKFEIEFYKKIDETLDQIWTRWRESKKKKLSVPAPDSGLIIPGGRRVKKD